MKQKALYIFILLLCGFSANVWAQTQCLSLVWADEFDYTGLPDPDKWGYDVGGGGWGNQELQYYTEDREENAYVDNGVLTITAIKEPFSGRGYTSARLVTRGQGDWLYGRFEIRAKLPTGRGTWPAIWMLPTDWEYGGWPASGEIDIMEHVGYDQNRIHGTVHTEAYNHQKGTQKSNTRVDSDVSTAFHTYVIEWYPDRIDWYIDEVKYFTFRNENKTFAEWPFDKRFHLLLNIAVGGAWGGAEGVDENIWPQTMEIDFVRVYGFGVTPEITGDLYVSEGASEAVYSATEYTGDITYNWTVPEGATITSGQGTSQITVDWGTTPGTVSVTFEGNTGCEVQEVSAEVGFVITPDADPYTAAPFASGKVESLEAIPGEGNTITLTEEADGSVRVDYVVTDVSEGPHVYVPFDEVLDLSEHREITVSLKGTGSTRPVLFYAEDAFGFLSNANNFLVNVPGDDAFGEYTYDYTGKWLSNYPVTGAMLDSTKVKALRAYVNTGEGTFWINGITVQKPEEDEVVESIPELLPEGWALYPNPIEAGGTLTLKHTEPLVGVELMDPQGRVVSVSTTQQGGVSKIQLPLASAGVYWLRITPQSNPPVVQKIMLR